MRDKAATPRTTRFEATTYSFSLRLRGTAGTNGTSRPFDTLRLKWHDYPGEWFEESPASDAESKRRVNTFRALLRSDVALLLVDGEKLMEHSGEEDRYLKSLLTNFRQGLLHLKDELLDEGSPLTEFPRIWIIALSKADLFPDWDVDMFRDIVILNAADTIETLRGTIKEFVTVPEALSLGDDFILLSSAKFDRSTPQSGPAQIDVTKRVGLDLILPIASLLPLERRVQWTERMAIPRKVLDTLAHNAGDLAAVLNTGRLAKIENVLARVPKVGDKARIAMPMLKAAAQMAGPQLVEMNARARDQRDYLKATLTQFKLNLEHGVQEKVLRTAR